MIYGSHLCPPDFFEEDFLLLLPEDLDFFDFFGGEALTLTVCVS
jgi:hypothetical protein